MPFADYYVPPAPPVTGFKSGMYQGTIKDAVLVRDATGAPKLMPDSGKTIAKISVGIDGRVNDKGEPLVLNRQVAVSFGQNNKDKKWSIFAVLIEVCTGIPCGDPRQINAVDFPDLIGKPVQVLTVIADPYINIDAFFPPTDEQVARYNAGRHTANNYDGHPSTTPAARTGPPQNGNGALRPPSSAARPPQPGAAIPSSQFGKATPPPTSFPPSSFVDPKLAPPSSPPPPPAPVVDELEGRQPHPDEKGWLDYFAKGGDPSQLTPGFEINGYGRIVECLPPQRAAEAQTYNEVPEDDIPFDERA